MKIVILLALILALIGGTISAIPSIPENCYTSHIDFDEFGVDECAKGDTVIMYLIDEYEPMVQTTFRVVTLGRMIELYGKPTRTSNNPPTYIWRRAVSFDRIVAMELNGRPGLDMIALSQSDITLLLPTPTPVRGGHGGY